MKVQNLHRAPTVPCRAIPLRFHNCRDVFSFGSDYTFGPFEPSAH